MTTQRRARISHLQSMMHQSRKKFQKLKGRAKVTRRLKATTTRMVKGLKLKKPSRSMGRKGSRISSNTARNKNTEKSSNSSRMARISTVRRAKIMAKRTVRVSRCMEMRKVRRVKNNIEQT